MMSTGELIAVLITAYGVWLMARRTLWCWPVSLIGNLMYIGIFFDSKLYSDMLLQGFFAGANAFGWWQWQQGRPKHAGRRAPVAVARPRRRELQLGLLLGSMGIVALGAPMAQYTDASAPWLDAALTSFSLIATLWTARRFIIAWWLWIALDVIYIGLFLWKQLYPTAGLYLIMMGLCFYALLQWRRGSGDDRSAQPGE